MSHFIYILECADSSYYVGFTTDLKKRLRKHNEGSGGWNTRIKRPVVLLYQEQFPTKIEALKRETQLKKWSRAKKKALIDGNLKALKEFSKRRT